MFSPLKYNGAGTTAKHVGIVGYEGGRGGEVVEREGERQGWRGDEGSEEED